MKRSRMLFLLSLLYFMIGIGLIVNFFFIQPIDLNTLSEDGIDFDEETIMVVGELLPAETDLSEIIAFEEETFTYNLEKDQEQILVVSPEKRSGLVFLEGKFVAFDPSLNMPNFIYAPTLSQATEMERMGISREGGIALIIYVVLASAAFLYELKPEPT